MQMRPEAMVQEQRLSGLGEKIKGNSGDNAGDRSSIACGKATSLDHRAVWSRILIKEDIPQSWCGQPSGTTTAQNE